jgi:hypothetical protein
LPRTVARPTEAIAVCAVPVVGAVPGVAGVPLPGAGFGVGTTVCAIAAPHADAAGTFALSPL